MSEAIFYKEAAPLIEASELSKAAAAVITYQSCMLTVKDYLTQTEVYEVLVHPEENAAALDTMIEAAAITDEAELRKAQAVAYLLQRLAFERARILEDRRKDFKFRRNSRPAEEGE